MIKYSIGGPITSIKDENSVEEKENTNALDQVINVIVCKKCGLQHALIKNEQRICCGQLVEQKLS